MSIQPQTRHALERAENGDYSLIESMLTCDVSKDFEPDWQRLGELSEISGASGKELRINSDLLNHTGMADAFESVCPLGEVVFFAREGGLSSLLDAWLGMQRFNLGALAQLSLLPLITTRPYRQQLSDLKPSVLLGLVDRLASYGVQMGETGISWMLADPEAMQKTADCVEKGDFPLSKGARAWYVDWQNNKQRLRFMSRLPVDGLGVIHISPQQISEFIESQPDTVQSARRFFLEASSQGILKAAAIKALISHGLDLGELPHDLGSTEQIEVFHSCALYNRPMGVRNQYEKIARLTINALTALIQECTGECVAILSQVECDPQLEAKVLQDWASHHPGVREHYSARMLEDQLSSDLGL